MFMNPLTSFPFFRGEFVLSPSTVLINEPQLFHFSFRAVRFEEFGLGGTRVKDKFVEALHQIIYSSCDVLQKARIIRPDLHSKHGILLLSELKKCTALKKIEITHASVTSIKSNPLLSRQISSWLAPDVFGGLKEVSLSSCNFSAVFLKQLVTVLIYLPAIEILDLSLCNVPMKLATTLSVLCRGNLKAGTETREKRLKLKLVELNLTTEDGYVLAKYIDCVSVVKVTFSRPNEGMTVFKTQVLKRYDQKVTIIPKNPRGKRKVAFWSCFVQENMYIFLSWKYENQRLFLNVP